MARAKPRPSKKWSVDQMMLNVASSLVRDFQDNLGDSLLCVDFLAALRQGDVEEIRKLCPAPDFRSESVSHFKALYQLGSVVKRYRFRKDIYSDQELIDKSIMTFIETQDRIRDHDLSDVDAFTTFVLESARTYIAQTLGVYSDEEHRSLCRFGRRASVGIPSRMACEAARWELPISGSHQQISWFDSEMSQDVSVQEYWAAQKVKDPNRSTYHETSCLTLALVPKTFKSLRSIMPNTTIGSYMSFGLGEMIRKRLRRKGLDIRTLQAKHRAMARQASIHEQYVTADLSSASDTISVALVERLFPRDWYEILTKSRIEEVLLPDGQRIESKTFCTMGIGYTFPLQTLVFLSLLKGIEAALYKRWNRRTISVYGDDMIYAASMHNDVVRVFEQLGFVINLDKTYHDVPFRESCGGDYFRGVDVRPFQPRNGSANVSAKAYEAMLYKYINGLLMRWSEHEIGRTLAYLCSQVEIVTNKLKLVPNSYPDDSGVKCPTLRWWDFLHHVEVAKPKSVGHGLYRFSFLRLVPDEREEVRHEPYYWQRLRGYSVNDYYSRPQLYPGDGQSFNDHTVSVVVTKDLVSPLKLREVKQSQTPRDKSQRRLSRWATFVTVSHTGSYQRRSGISEFEIRR